MSVLLDLFNKESSAITFVILTNIQINLAFVTPRNAFTTVRDAASLAVSVLVAY
jgi:hypothetical protein